jgi:hypothetical protein
MLLRNLLFPCCSSTARGLAEMEVFDGTAIMSFSKNASGA